MKIIGHRGAKGLAPENTIAGLRVAISHGVDGVEFDVRVTKDNIAILTHDKSIDSISGIEHSIREHTFAELQSVRLELCTLVAALHAIDRRVPAFIEVKPDTPIEPVISIIRKLRVQGWKAQDFAFLSFDFGILKELHAAFPDVPIIINEPWSSIRAVWRARQLGTKQIDISYKVLWSGVIRSLSRRGYRLYTFGLNNEDKAKFWKECGLYGVITDYPDRMQHLKVR